MTSLTIYAGDRTGSPETISNYQDIVKKLKDIGVQLERWAAVRPLPEDANQETVLAAYQDSIGQLNAQYGFQSVDVVSVQPEYPQKKEFREKFLAEHTHEDFEIRFFVEGKGLFYLHVGGKVYLVLCEAGDLMSVPAKTAHWFDMGENPNFKCIRFFTTKDGWAANFTGSDMASCFPSFDEYFTSLP
jgi:1,2-dihydroxy-3-keto-5-methylthiopentene dioxygenase